MDALDQVVAQLVYQNLLLTWIVWVLGGLLVVATARLGLTWWRGKT